MKILIAGVAGLIGHHLARSLARHHQVTALTHGALDITDGDAVRRRVFDGRFSLVVNCAVLQVDASEANPGKAQAVNIEGPRNLAAAANKVGAELVHFSTQYAFAGEPIGRRPYTVDDETGPVNVYGRTKLAGEEAVKEKCARSYLIRTSWVYGSGKNSFLCTVYNDLCAGKRVRAIDDVWSSTTYVKDLIDRLLLILRAGCHDTYHVVNEGVLSYYEFALEAGRLAGLNREKLEPLIEIVKEADMKRPAARPRYTPLRCLNSEKLGFPPMRQWRDALAAYVRMSRP